MDVWIGTAGYAYPDWAGGFYPPGTPAAGQLAYYARHFPAVEINSTFYRPPTPEQVAKMAARVPAGFRFSLKVPKSASHGFDPGELPAFAAAAGVLADSGKLLGLVLQFPESFRNERPSRDWLARVRAALDRFPVAVEFRHRSWDVPALPGWLARHRLDGASVGVPDLPQLFPPGPRLLGERFYARLHSAHAGNWYAGGPLRYDYDYPEESLRTWAAGLARAAADGCREAVVIFNNCVAVQAVANAKRFADVVRETVPTAVVIPPPARPDATLFDGLG